MKMSLALALFFIQWFTNAQTSWKRYACDSTSNITASNTYYETLEFLQEKYEESEAVKQYSGAFVRDVAMEKALLVLSGEVYFGQEELANYVKRVLKVLVKDSSILEQIKIRFLRDASLNGSMSASGDLYLNVGTLALLDNEAELAALLGHEIGHYVHDDAAYRYSEIADKLYRPKKFYEWGTAADKAAANLRDVMKFTRKQEEAADAYSVYLLRNSSYSMVSAISFYRKLNRTYIRHAIRYGSSNPTYHSHPNPRERVKMLKSLDPRRSNQKDFIVDSLMFGRLKRFGYTETVNICLLENNYSVLSEICFTKYLLDPNDAENLSILVEALRRTRLFMDETNFNRKSFILDRYQTEHIRNSINYAFLNERSPSILNHVEAGFINLWREDAPRIKAKDLADRESVEFTTNAEALNYFSKRLEESSVFPPSIISNTALSTVQKNLSTGAAGIFASADYLQFKSDTLISKGDLFVLMSPSYNEAIKVSNARTLHELADWRQNLRGVIGRSSGRPVELLSNLPISQQYKLWGLMSHASFFLDKEGSGTFTKTGVNWGEYCPELFSLFKSRSVSSVYIIYPYLTVNSQGIKQVSLHNFRVFAPLGNKVTMCRRVDDFQITENSDDLEYEIAKRFARFVGKAEKLN